MNKFLVAVLLFCSFFLLSFAQAQARQGCCSHHGGVCGCGCCDGSSLSAKCAPYYPECSGAKPIEETKPVEVKPKIISTPLSTPAPKLPTPVPQIKGTKTELPKPTLKPTVKPSKVPVSQCSAVADQVCSNNCTAGNDSDCCATVDGYQWYDNWGCYPKKLLCSDQADGVCHAYCSAGNDADCCTERLSTHTWYPNWGCYPK